jgi:hypothetical protein
MRNPTPVIINRTKYSTHPVERRRESPASTRINQTGLIVPNDPALLHKMKMLTTSEADDPQPTMLMIDLGSSFRIKPFTRNPIKGNNGISQAYCRTLFISFSAGAVKNFYYLPENKTSRLI